MKRNRESGEEQAQQRFNSRKRAAAFYANQRLNYLSPLMQEFIARQTMAFIATADAHGACDCSFRAGALGFIQVLNATTLIYPEYKGNGVFASVGNILENPQIGMIFLDFFQSTIGLHVNGKARIISPNDLAALLCLDKIAHSVFLKATQRPEAWIIVEIEETYIHCSKHVPLLKQQRKQMVKGMEEQSRKSGDFFKTKQIQNLKKQEF